MFKLYDKNMNLIEFPDGVTPLDIFISSITKERETDTIEGRSGVINYGFTNSEREIRVEFLLKAHDTRDYRLLRDSLYATLQAHDEMYVVEEYQAGKRYLVSVDEQFIPERIEGNQRFAKAEITFSMIGLPYAESIGTTQDIEENGVDANDELWGFGMGLTSGENLKYTHNGNNFSVFNAGNVGVHPFEQELKIIINNVTRPLNYLELKNETNGSSFRITVKVHEGDEIVYDGANIRINGLEALRRTNRKYIQLNPGWNNFKLDGAESAEVSMFFRFYYL